MCHVQLQVFLVYLNLPNWKFKSKVGKVRVITVTPLFKAFLIGNVPDKFAYLDFTKGLV